MAANLALQKHIQNYAKTKDVYEAYRKSGYSKKFFEEHWAEITLHKAAKEAYKGYREAKREMQELLKARQNVKHFYGDDLKKEREVAKAREITGQPDID